MAAAPAALEERDAGAFVLGGPMLKFAALTFPKVDIGSGSIHCTLLPSALKRTV